MITRFILRQGRYIGLLSLILLLLHARAAQAGSATWDLNPVSGDWNTAANWTPNTVPDGPDDIATFDVSNQTAINVSIFGTETNELIFNPGASAFTISQDDTWTISGTGITNNSGLTQNFLVRSYSFVLTNSATAGDMTSFTVTGDMQFQDAASASHGTFLIEGDMYDGGLSFADHSTAADGNFTVSGADVAFGTIGRLDFFDDSTAANGVSVANGGTVEGAPGGVILFATGVTQHTGTADNATLIANPGTNGGYGGVIKFTGQAADHNTARFELFGNGTLDMTYTVFGERMIGSVEGDGVVENGDELATGANNLSTTFSGTIQGAGSLEKIGTGTFTLSGANTYTGGTTVSAGALVIGNTTGSGTGTGKVAVSGGTLGGTGTISGAVTVGAGSGSGATLQPSFGTNKKVTLTIQSLLTFKSDSTYNFHLKSRTAEVVANGLTIKSGAQFLLTAPTRKLPAGASATVISNTSTSAINGVFANLPDVDTITVGSNTFQANYEGGDGNDLTLTVVQ